MRRPLFFWLASALLLAAGTLGRLHARFAEVKPPDTPAGKQLAGWLRAYNSGQVETARQFIQQHYAPSLLQEKDGLKRHLSAFNMVYGDNGPLELVRIDKSADHEVEAVLRSPAADAGLKVTIRVEDKSPHGISNIRISFTEEPEHSVQTKRDDQEIARQLQDYVERLAKADLFSGTVLLAREDKVLYTAAHGLASKAYKAPMRIDTKLNLGSMGKMFTAVAIAQLEQEGKLSFEDTLGKHLPDYPNKDAAQKVKLHHLLTHTSGIGDYFTKEFMDASRERFRTVRDFFPLFVDKPLSFEPGSQFRYSNAGYLLLGAVIEKITGRSYFDYVQERIFRPTGMINTGYFDMDHDTPNLAIGYTRELPERGKLGSQWKNNLFMHVIRGGPAGGGFSTVEDLLRFAVALRSHKLLDEKHTELVLSPKTNFGKSPARKYGYGFVLETVGGTRIAGHGGGFPGINAELNMYLDKGYTVVVLSNYDMAARRVADKARRLITAE